MMNFASNRWDLPARATRYGLAATLVVLALLGGFPLANASAQDDAVSGISVYQQWCILCHGLKGKGSPLGSSLISDSVMAKSDLEILKLITRGNIRKGMLKFGGRLTREEIQAAMGYIRELQGKKATLQSNAPKKDAHLDKKIIAAGESVFKGKARCFNCHSVIDAGGLTGPDLSTIASVLTMEKIREAVESPSARISSEFALKIIKTRRGKTIRGRYRNDRPDSIQLLSDKGTLWTTYFKSDLASIGDVTTSLMPEDLLSKLTDDDVKVLFAYLGSLR